MWKAACLLGLEEILDSAFPTKTVKGMSRGRVLVLEAIHHAVDPGSKASFADWCEGTSLPDHLGFCAGSLDSQAIWEAMDGVGEEEVDAAQRAVVARLRELFPGDLGSLHLDYTNYHTWIDSRNNRCTICLRGHNKQKRNDLRQYSLAVVMPRELQAALVWDLYDGNVNDKTEFARFKEKVAAELGADASDCTVTFDGGGNSRESLSGLPFHFVCSHTLVGLSHLLDVDRALYEEVDIGGGHTRVAHRVDGLEFSGVTGTGVLTLSEDLERGQRAALRKQDAALAKRGAGIVERLRKPRSSLFAKLRARRREWERDALEAREHNRRLAEDQAEGRRTRCRPREEPGEFDEVAAMREVVEDELFKGRAALRAYWSFEVTRGGDGAWALSDSLDAGAREAHCLRAFGKKLTVTDRTEWTTAEILETYAAQERVEDLFRTTKDVRHFSMRPQWHWTDQKIRMHVFLCLLSVTLAEILRKHAEAAGVRVTKHALLDRLGTIHEGRMTVGGRTYRAVERPRGEVARLWEAVLAMPGEGLGP